MSSSSEDWSESRKEPCARRRSTRLSRQAAQIPKPAQSTTEKHSKKSNAKSSTTPAKKKKLSPAVKQGTPYKSTDTLLTQEEIKILFDKWNRDRHYRTASPPAIQAPLVVSTTTDGKNVTTNISCYKGKKYFMHKLASNLASSSGIAARSAHFDDRDIASSLHFSTPITEALRSVRDLNSSNQRNDSAKNASPETNKRNSTETAPQTSTLEPSTSAQGIPIPPENPRNAQPNIPTFNIPQIESSGFVTPTRPNQSQTTRDDPLIHHPNLNPWILPAASNSNAENGSRAISSGSYLPRNDNVQHTYTGSVPTNDLYGNFNRPDFQTSRYDNGVNPNTQNAFPAQNRNNPANTFNNWNPIYQMSFNNFPGNQSLNQNNDSRYTSPAIGNRLMRDSSNSSEYSSSSVPSWNAEQYWNTNHWNGGNPYNNMYGNPNSAGVQQYNKENWPSNIGNDNSAIFNNVSGVFYNNLPEIKNIENDLLQLDVERPGFDGNSSSSSSSYDDDIKYNKNSADVNKNAGSTTLNDGYLPSFFIKSEMIAHSSGETGHLRCNNDSLPVLRNFHETQECIQIE